MRLQETSEVFEQARNLSKKTKTDFEKVKKIRYAIIMMIACWFPAVWNSIVFYFIFLNIIYHNL